MRSVVAVAQFARRASVESITDSGRFPSFVAIVEEVRPRSYSVAD